MNKNDRNENGVAIQLYPLLLSLIFLMAVVSSAANAAIECGYTEVFTKNESRALVGLNISTVGEDVPVGKILYTSKQVLGGISSSGYYCGIKDVNDIPGPNDPEPYMDVYNIVEVVSTPSGAPNRTGGKDIFPTNVPGIGVTFTISGALYKQTQFPALWQNRVSLGWGTMTQSFGLLGEVIIELVKTGPIPPGTQQIVGSSFPGFRIRAGSTHPYAADNTFVNLNFEGTTTVYTKTCQLATANINVDLGKHDITSFDGVGSGSPWKDFDIILKDCPPFYGYGNYKEMYFNDPPLSGANTPNDVAISFRSANGVVDGNPNLAKLKEGPGTAAGVGIEVAQRTLSTSIPLDGTGGFTLENLPKEENTTYTIPLKARYVQSEPTVQAGLANGAVEFTITYQ